jgi:hypothetical protein
MNEEIVIRNNSLIAFEETVSFVQIRKEKILKKNEFFSVIGPGLILFEVNNFKAKTEELSGRINIKLFFFLFLLYVLITVVSNWHLLYRIDIS